MIVVGAVAIPVSYLLVNNAGEASPAIIQRLSGITGGVIAFLVFLGGSLALVWTRYRNTIGPSLFGVLAVVWVASDLIFSGSGVDVGAGEPIRNFDHPEVIEFFQQDTELYRVDTITNVWDVWQPNATLLYRLYDVMGGYNPLLLNDTERYWATLGSRSTPIYDLLNAKYIIGHKDVPLDWDKWVLAFDGDPQVNVYRNINVMPRAFLVGQARLFAEREALFSAMHGPEFDPSRDVYLEQSSGRPEEAKETGSGIAEVISFSPNSIELETESDGSAYLVLGESYYPGWRATVDDRPVEVLRANYRFRAVPVNQGRHTVRLSFEPDSWRWGAASSLITLLGLICWYIWHVVAKRRAGTEAG
jgi:hypothetical protein